MVLMEAIIKREWLVLVPAQYSYRYNTNTNLALLPIAPVQGMYCDLYYVLARASTCYLPTLIAPEPKTRKKVTLRQG